jgi:hypothetical protein
VQEVSFRVPFGGGINTKIDEKTVPYTELLRAENVVFDKLTSLKKRNGYTALAPDIDGGGTLTGAVAMASRDSERLVFTRSRCYSRMTGQEKWSDVGAVYSVLGTDRPLSRNGSQQTVPDCATNRGVIVAAWEDTQGGVWWSVSDESGHQIKASTQADASGASPRCVAVGDNLHVYYIVATFLYVVVIDTASPSADATPVLVVDDVNSVYDACPTERTATPSLFAYVSISNNVVVGYIDQSGVLSGPLFNQPSPSTFVAFADFLSTIEAPIAVAYAYVDGGNGDYIAIGCGSQQCITFCTGGSFSNAIATRVDGVTGVGGPVGTIDRVALAIALDSSNVATVWSAWEYDDAEATNHFVDMASTTIAGVSTQSTILSVGIVSRAFVIDDRAFVTLVHDTDFFNTYITYRIDPSSTPVPVARLATGRASGLPARQHVTSVNVIDGVARFCLPERERVISESGSEFRETGIRLFDLDFESTSTYQYSQLGRGLYLGGACPMHYDGRTWTEMGFHVGPELIVATPSAGGSMTSGTTYEYRAWYEWTDAQGEVHRGPTSAGTLVTMGGADTQVTLTLPMLRVTLKDRARICVARSLAAKTGKTAQLFRVTSLDMSTAGSANGIVINDPTTDTATFIDRMSDTTLADQEEIYTDGGILSNDPAPLGHVVARLRNRLLFNDPGNPYLLRYSQDLEDGFGVEIPPDLSFPVDPYGGRITAAASQDDRGIIWQERAIRFFNGDGPTANGDTSSSGFSSPQLVTSDVGCTNPASIVLTPKGYMFQSTKGIYNIGPDGEVSYVGAAVEAYNDQTIKRAVLLPNRTSVLFLTNSGLSLVYDYQRAAWYTWTNHEGLDAIVVDDELYYLRTDGSLVYKETVGEYSDAGLSITILIATAWIHMQEHLQGFQKFLNAYIIGTWLTPHQLGVQYQTDYSPMLGAPVWLDATGDTSSTGWITGTRAQRIGVQPILGSSYGDGAFGDGVFGGTPDDVYQWRMQLLEKGESIQFVFTDFQKPGTFGPSFELTEILITGGIKGAAPKPVTKGRSI